jgi:CspA family cold shock protein
MIGTVKSFNKTKGFGFLTLDDGGRDIFIPPPEAKFCGLELRDGDRVEFEMAPNPRREGGFVAQNIRTSLPAFVR